MATCEMCGHLGNVTKAIVEGTLLDLCDHCVRFGDVVAVKQPPQEVVSKRLDFLYNRRYLSTPIPKIEEYVIHPDYALRVKRARERTRKTQEDVALALAEKVTVLQKVENGNMQPSLPLAKKLEQFFKVTLIVKEQKADITQIDGLTGVGNTGSVTIGDIIKIKKI